MQTCDVGIAAYLSLLERKTLQFSEKAKTPKVVSGKLEKGDYSRGSWGVVGKNHLHSGNLVTPRRAGTEAILVARSRRNKVSWRGYLTHHDWPRPITVQVSNTRRKGGGRDDAGRTLTKNLRLWGSLHGQSEVLWAVCISKGSGVALRVSRGEKIKASGRGAMYQVAWGRQHLLVFKCKRKQESRGGSMLRGTNSTTVAMGVEAT